MTMSFCNYHKIYMNHVHSSSLLCQLSALWKSQTLCDAAIKTGSVVVRAHRVVLVAACPMLQSMENATAGSHLEIRVASDIKQDSINAFLQYLYEGYMMLTEENCRDVEKIARLLHVDNVLNCCADFNKCMNSSSPYKYSGQDQAEFKHVRITDLLKVQDRPSKRFQSYSGSQSAKRARMQQQNSADAFSPVGGENYSGTDESCSIPDPWERVPRSGHNYQPGVIDVRQEGIELIQTEPPSDGKQRRTSAPVPTQSVSLSLSSQFNTVVDKRVVDVTKQDSNLNEKRPSSTSQNTLSFSRSRQSAPQNLSNVVDLSNMIPSTSFEIGPEVQNVHGNSELPVRTFEDTKRNSKSADIYPVSITEISRPDSQPQSTLDLPYAAGNASQIPSNSSSKDTSQLSEGHQQQTDIDWGPRQKTISPQYQSDNSLSVDITGDTDVSIIKVEPNEIPPPSEGPEGGLFSQPMANLNIADQVNQGQTNPVGDWSLNSFSLPGDSNTSQVELSESSVIESTQGEFNFFQENVKPGILPRRVALQHKMIELLPGSGVYLYPHQIKQAEVFQLGLYGSSSHGRHMSKMLMNIFWNKEDLIGATISRDSVDKKLLDPQIVNAIEGQPRQRNTLLDLEEVISIPDDETPETTEKSSVNFGDILTPLTQRCKICYLLLPTGVSLTKHLRVAHGDQLWIAACEECGKGFKSYGGYSMHCKMYHSDKKFPTCQRCGKKFTSESHLRVHMIKHTDEKQFQCQHCSKRFKYRATMFGHMHSCSSKPS